MKVSTRAHYGLRAMVTIAQLTENGHSPVSVMDIARREDLSDTYLEQLVSKLRRGGLLRSFRGAKGGYELTRAPKDMTVLEILEASGEKLVFPECTHRDEGCDRAVRIGSLCPSALFWRDLSSAVLNMARNTTLADIILRAADAETKVKAAEQSRPQETEN